MQISEAEAAVIYVPDNYTKIQWAIGNASAGDTILVKNGTYVENVNVDRGVKIICEQRNCTLRAENSDSHVVRFSASGGELQGFTITGASTIPWLGERWGGSGIYVDNVNSIRIADNRITGNVKGIFLYWFADSNTIVNNTITGNSQEGIKLYTSHNNLILNNTISLNGLGIYLRDGGNNRIANNTLSNNTGFWGYGIVIWSSGNRITGNTIQYNEGGIEVIKSNNTISNNTIIRNQNRGILVKYDDTTTSPHRIERNTIAHNSIGIEADGMCTINSNSVCYNSQTDFNSNRNFAYSDGDLNTCDNPGGWNDARATGCTYTCQVSTTLLSGNYSSNRSFTENVTLHNLTGTVSANGSLIGTVNLSLELLEIVSGSFSESGFSTAEWNASLNSSSYSGKMRLVVKNSSGRISFRGATSGDIAGAVEGYLQRKSWGYELHATWHYLKLKGQTSAGKIVLKGNLSTKGRTDANANFYSLQTKIQGRTSGNYTTPLDTVLTLVRVVNGSRKNEGFAVLTYVSEYGSGRGWLYAFHNQSATELTGMFGSPLHSRVSGTLDETKTPPELSLGIDRFRVEGANLSVRVYAPSTALVSPYAESPPVNVLVEYINDGRESAQDVDVVLSFFNTTFRAASAGGKYLPGAEEVVWRIPVIPPGYRRFVMASFYPSVGNMAFSASIYDIDRQYDPNASYNFTLVNESNGYLEIELNLSNATHSAKVHYTFRITTVEKGREVEFNHTLKGENMSISLNYTVSGGSSKLVEAVSKADEVYSQANEIMEKVEDFKERYSSADRYLHLLETLRKKNLISQKTYERFREKYKTAAWMNVGFGAVKEVAGGGTGGEYVGVLTDAGSAATRAAMGLSLRRLQEAILMDSGTFISLPTLKGIVSGDIKDVEGKLSVGHDPNAKYGKGGYVFPGERLSYKVEFENTGNTSAIGVYFTDVLDVGLNASTLEIGDVVAISSNASKNGTIIGNGSYNPQTRTITWILWNYGVVGPGEGGYAEINISVNSNASSGTEIVNYAVVHFPSAQEKTPTNPVSAQVVNYTWDGNGSCTCRNAVECTAALEDNTRCYREVKLGADILNHTSTVFNNPNNTSAKKLNCQGHVIGGTNASFSAALYLYNKTTTVIENCKITGFYYGIHLNRSSGIAIKNTTIISSIRGIQVVNSQNTTISLVNISEAVEYGIYLSSSEKTSVVKSQLSSSSYGVYLSSSSNNLISQNLLTSNKKHGIYLYNSSGNSIDGNTFKGSRVALALSSCDPSGGWCPGGAHNNSVRDNSFADNRLDFQSSSSSATVLNCSFGDAAVSFTYSGDIAVNSSAAPAGDPPGYRNLSRYINITNTSTAWVFLNMSYSQQNLAGISEDTIRIWRYNGSSWEIVQGGGVNQQGDYAFANITTFSIFAPFGTNDTTPPKFTFLPPTPANASFTDESWLYINITADETLSSAWLELWNGSWHTNLSMHGSGKSRYLNVSGIGEGKYSYRLWANDSFGNLGASGVRTFTRVLLAVSNSTTLSAGNTSTIINASDVVIDVTAARNASVNLSAYLSRVSIGAQELNSTSSAGKADKELRYLIVENTTALENLSRITLKLYYSEAELGNLDENTLGLFYWNGSAWLSTLDYVNRNIPGGPFVFDAGRNTAENYVYAVVNHTSHWALGGRVKQVAAAAPAEAGTYSPEAVILANSIDLALAEEFIAYLRGRGIKLYIVSASNFSEYSKRQYVIILGGHRAYEDVGDVAASLLGQEERKQIAEGRAYIKKRSIFRTGGVVYIFAGKDRYATREAWREAYREVAREIEYNW